MLNPTVVFVLLSFYKTGLLVVLGGAAFLGWRHGCRSEVLGLLCFWAIVAVAGLLVGFGILSLAVACFSAAIGASLRYISPKSPFTLFLVLPLALVGYLSWAAIWVAFDDRNNVLVPFWSERVTSTLEGRAYPHFFDSLPATRIVLVRLNSGSLEDDVVDEFFAYSPDRMSCSVAADAHIVLSFEEAGITEQKRMELLGHRKQ